MIRNGMYGQESLPARGQNNPGEVSRMHDVVRHVALALSRYICQLHHDGIAAPCELEELAALLGLLVKSRQDVTCIADGVRVSHHPCVESRLLITKREAAERIGVSVRTVERLAASGRLPLVHIERSVRFRVTDVEAFVQSLAGRRPPRSDSRTNGDQI